MGGAEHCKRVCPCPWQGLWPPLPGLRLAAARRVLCPGSVSGLQDSQEGTGPDLVVTQHPVPDTAGCTSPSAVWRDEPPAPRTAVWTPAWAGGALTTEGRPPGRDHDGQRHSLECSWSDPESCWLLQT